MKMGRLGPGPFWGFRSDVVTPIYTLLLCPSWPQAWCGSGRLLHSRWDPTLPLQGQNVPVLQLIVDSCFLFLSLFSHALGVQFLSLCLLEVLHSSMGFCSPSSERSCPLHAACAPYIHMTCHRVPLLSVPLSLPLLCLPSLPCA